MTELEKNTCADPSEGQRIAPATMGECPAEENSPRVSAFDAKKIIAAVAACLVVVAVAIGVAFGMGNTPSNQGQDAVSNQSVSAAATATANTQAENQTPDQSSPENTNIAEAVGSASNEQVGQEGQVSAEPSSDNASSGSTSAGSSEGHSSSGSSAGSSAQPSDPQPEPAPKPSTITVHVYIDSSRAPGYGKCMASKNVTLSEGSSVYDALCATGVSVGGSSTYVSSINGLKEKLPGHDGSGWMYSVDGDYPMKACGKYKLSGGESIRWSYTLDLGNDL